MKGDVKKEIGRNKTRNGSSRIDNRIHKERVQFRYYLEYMGFWYYLGEKCQIIPNSRRFASD